MWSGPGKRPSSDRATENMRTKDNVVLQLPESRDTALKKLKHDFIKVFYPEERLFYNKNVSIESPDS